MVSNWGKKGEGGDGSHVNLVTNLHLLRASRKVSYIDGASISPEAT